MPNELKKSLLITLDFPPRLGGVATYYHSVCKNLPADKIVVLAPKQEGAESFDQAQNFTIIRKKMLGQFPEVWPKSLGGIIKIISRIKWLSIIRHLASVAKTHKIEIIQAGQILPLGTLAWLFWRRKKIPYIFYAHGLDITLPQRFMRKKTLLKKIIVNAKGMVANSYFTKDELVKLGADSKKIIVVYPCPNLELQQVSETETAKIINDYGLKNKKILLTVGRLVERKGHDLTIKSLPKIIKQVPNVAYLIVGSGPREKYLKDLTVQSGLSEHVQFIGAVDQKKLAALYQVCDAFIMPSRQLANGDVEGFGIVYLEANLFGKPAIGGKSGGVPEAIVDGKTGLLVDPNSVNEIALAAIKLLTDPAYAERLGLQGLERVSNEFNWFSQTAKIKSLLN